MRKAPGRKPNRQVSHRSSPANDPAHAHRQVIAELVAWRANARVPALREFARGLAGLEWNGALFLLLLEELHIGDEFDALVGRPENLPVKRYPEAIAVAIALRHSWRPDDLADVVESVLKRRV
jgi:hypothetical protein